MLKNIIKNSRVKFKYFSTIPRIDINDALCIHNYFNQEEKLIDETSRKFCNQVLKPKLKKDFKDPMLNKSLIKEMGSAGLLGITSQKEAFSYVSYGILCKEFESIDSSFRSSLSVQSSLVIYPINKYGTEYQKRKYLDKLISGDLIGCFGLTEPNYGSEPSGMKTRALKEDNHYILNGSKMWITNSPISDILIVWAKENIEGKETISGFICEKDMEGLTTNIINNKLSLEKSITGDIILQNVKVPKENKLNISGLKGPFNCLNQARLGISWGVLGAAIDSLSQTLEYSDQRIIFDKKLSQFQITQIKYSDMVSKLSLGLLGSFHVSRLKDQNLDNHIMTSILKRNNCIISLETCQICRDILGANGITSDYSPLRHLLNMQSVSTYEGTTDIHSLIIGRAITGENAFS